ncbi:MAG: YciI family protein [Pirellulaceae bacterium]|nr:YciI family protein [Pirellulaceae bacterium]
MKFICLGYADMSKFAAMDPAELQAAMDECFDYDDLLRKGGHFAGGEALQEPSKAVTLRFRDGRVQLTDGPFAETKEQLGGILILEADSLEHAIELMSKHPGVRTGPFEIRPADESINGLIQAREQRFASNSTKK